VKVREVIAWQNGPGGHDSSFLLVCQVGVRDAIATVSAEVGGSHLP
jgi:hypothetical protein